MLSRVDSKIYRKFLMMIHTSKECNNLIDYIHLHAFFYKQHFYKQHQAEIDKSQAKAKQHLEAELLLFENILLHHVIIQK